MNISIAVLIRDSESLNRQIEALHNHLIDSFPIIDRMACALYDQKEDILKTFINSTRCGTALKGYEFKLSESYSLSKLAKTGEVRVINDIPNEVTSQAQHALWVNDQGYKSSFTIPLIHGEDLLGFVFFDSTKKSAFTESVQKNLLLYCNIISMTILNEFAAVHTLLESVRIARDLAEVRDFETGTHLERMARYSRLIAKHIAKKRNLNDEFVESVYLFAPLHDIGKIGIPDSVLLKPGRLSPSERVIMQTHVEKGVQIVNRIAGTGVDECLVNAEILRNIVAGHHEYLDGTGYPSGLKGDQISIEARIVTVADIYDALTNKRPYKSEWTHEMALTELLNMERAGKLDKDCVDALIEHKEEFMAIQSRYFDENI